jgi:hypothetical protein
MSTIIIALIVWMFFNEAAVHGALTGYTFPHPAVDSQVLSGQWVPALAMGLRLVLVPPLLHHIAHVVERCTNEEVVWIEAPRIVAMMANEPAAVGMVKPREDYRSCSGNSQRLTK